MLIKFAKIRGMLITRPSAKSCWNFSAFSSILQEFTDIPVRWEYSQMAYPQLIVNIPLITVV